MEKVRKYLDQACIMCIGTNEEIRDSVNPFLSATFYGLEIGFAGRLLSYSIQNKIFNPWLLPFYLDAGFRGFKMIRWFIRSMKYSHAVNILGEYQDQFCFPEPDLFSGIIGYIRESQKRRRLRLEAKL